MNASNGNGLLAQLDDIDLAPILAYHCKKFNIEQDLASEALIELKKWLILNSLYPDSDFPMMSKEIDDLWHSAILYSPIYVNLCNRIAGEYIHHVPCLDGDASSEAERVLIEQDTVKRYHQFLDAYSCEFGHSALRTNLWPSYVRSPGENCTSCQTAPSRPVRGCGFCGIRG